MDKTSVAGHIMAFVTVLIWGNNVHIYQDPARRFCSGGDFVLPVFTGASGVGDRLSDMAGICLISFNGAKLELSPAGDALAVLAAFMWAVYSLLTRKISSYGYHTVQTTRRIFVYGIFFMVPALFFFHIHFDAGKFAKPEFLLNLLYLGIGASALCFVTWNCAVKTLGALKTSVYIYLVPVVTIVTSSIVLKEKITAMSAVGTGLTLAGLFLSESRSGFRRGGKINECGK